LSFSEISGASLYTSTALRQRCWGSDAGHRLFCDRAIDFRRLAGELSPATITGLFERLLAQYESHLAKGGQSFYAFLDDWRHSRGEFFTFFPFQPLLRRQLLAELAAVLVRHEY